VESQTGYVLNLLPYISKRVKTAVSKTTQIVLDVGKDYLNKGHQFFTDNYYTSIELITKSEEQNTLSCCTVNQNRSWLPKDAKTCAVVKNPKRGNCLKRMKGRYLAVTWRDTRIVKVLCNVTGYLGDGAVRRRDRKGAQIKISAIELYNSFMGGVNLSNQRVSSYRHHMKSLTWYLQVFFHILHFYSYLVCRLTSYAKRWIVESAEYLGTTLTSVLGLPIIHDENSPLVKQYWNSWGDWVSNNI